MAREIAIAQPHTRVAAARWRNSQWFGLRSVWEGLLPVAQIGHRDFSDQERPAWMISAICGEAFSTGYVPSATITSAYDLAIERIQWNTYHRGGTPLQYPITIGMPIVGYLPWDNPNPLVVPFYFTAGVRPTLRFDTGRTMVIAGMNPGTQPLVGWQGASPLDGQSYSENPGLTFDPPLILPATMFLTVQLPVASTLLLVNWRYREIG